MNDCSQEGCLEQLPPSMGIRLDNDSVQVSETPLQDHEYTGPDGRGGCVSDQMRYPEQRQSKPSQQKKLKRKKVFIVIPETPPKFSPKLTRPKDEEVSGHDEWSNVGDAQVHTSKKRSKPSHHVR